MSLPWMQGQLGTSPVVDCIAYPLGIAEQTHPRYYLQKNVSGVFIDVAGPKYGPVGTEFTGLDPIAGHGIYRVVMFVPIYNTPSCNPGALLQELGTGVVLGYVRDWDLNSYYSNEVIVGPTVSTDIGFTFLDLPETGPEQAYDYLETVSIDVSSSKNYDLWWLAIIEDGNSGTNRYKTNGWTFGTVPNDEFNLSNLWSNPPDEWEFDVLDSYITQFVVENISCRNGVEWPGTSWNVKERTFFISPQGSGCKFVIDNTNIQLAPNPAGDYINLLNFRTDFDRKYRIVISDILTGMQHLNIPIASNEINISGMPSGTYIVSIFSDGERVFSSKLFKTY